MAQACRTPLPSLLSLLVSRAGILLVLASLIPTAAWAQLPRTYPQDDYYVVMRRAYVDGDYRTAGQNFLRTRGMRSTEGEWVDSIPRYTMAGESLYRMGDLGGALNQYNVALNLLVKYNDWMLRLSFPLNLESSQRANSRPPTWGTSTRQIRLARVPDPIPSLQGQTGNENMRALQRGGVLQAQQLLQIRAQEIARCAAVAIQRRGEILGLACRYDEFTGRLIAVLERRPAPPRHWSQAWISCQLGLAYASAGKYPEATTELNGALLVNGMDHALTPLALYELGKLAFLARQYPVAGRYFQEATFSAALQAPDDFGQFDVIADAFRWGMLAHRAAGSPQPYPPLAAAAAWAGRSSTGSRSLEGSLLITAAEDLAGRNDGKRAAVLLDQARVVLRRSECSLGALGGRMQYVLAHASYINGDAARGLAALDGAMKYAQTGSLWLFQMRLADQLFTSGALEEHQASPLYAHVLRDPVAEDWLVDPMEALTSLLAPNIGAYQHWLQVTLNRKEQDKALQISDQLRRRRLYGTLPLGGRVMNLRWTLDAPLDGLPESALPRRQDLLARQPALAQLSQQSAQIRAALAALPPVAEEPAQVQQENDLLKQLGDIGAAQEAVLAAIALGPEPNDMVFPPAFEITKIQQQLPPGQRILSFVSIPSGTYAFLMDNGQYQGWQLKNPTKIPALIGKLLGEMGLYDRSQVLTVEQLSDTAWKDTSAELLNQLTGNAPPDAWDKFEELIVVPDGPLWYVPFETLQVGTGDDRVPLINKVRIRYAPTLSLAVPDRRPRQRIAKTAVVVSRLFAHKDDTLARTLFDQLHNDDPATFEVPVKPLPPTSLYSTRLERLVVLGDLDNDTSGPYGWAPMSLDRGKPSGTLAQWMALPWGGPDQVVLPGFHTAAESGVKRGTTGDEVFLSVCGLMATGARTALVSRWPEGGRAAMDLIREFLRELPSRPASGAWQRAVRLAMVNDLVFSDEPRIKRPTDDAELKTDHPFFWSSHLLIDRGVIPK